jgi:hypothetical protein
MSDNAAMQVCECLYNPRWRWGTLPDGNMLLRLDHPKHGFMDFIITKETAGALLAFLSSNYEATPIAVSERIQ